MDSSPLVGVLALQGGFPVHAAALRQAGARVREVRSSRDLDDLSGLVLPGGESTVQSMLIDRYGLREALTLFCKTRPVMATCAGLILLSGDSGDRRVKPMGILDITVERNAYGSQLESFTEMLRFAPPDGGESDIPGVFIRAPKIRKIGSDVKVLSQRDGDPVAILSGKTLGLTFHPELSEDRTIHRFFLNMK